MAPLFQSPWILYFHLPFLIRLYQLVTWGRGERRANNSLIQIDDVRVFGVNSFYVSALLYVCDGVHWREHTSFPPQTLVSCNMDCLVEIRS